MTALPRFKIGTNRGRRRIWLDGRRLADAGFVGGTVYECLVRRGEIVCTIPEPGDREPIAPPPAGATVGQRKVTGRPDGKPIIDISGKAVETAFPAAETVKVRFEPGRITITSG
jgi:DNA (cytosine-5)-methyltransferase 1